jgi:hypothetical protein
MFIGSGLDRIWISEEDVNKIRLRGAPESQEKEQYVWEYVDRERTRDKRLEQIKAFLEGNSHTPDSNSWCDGCVVLSMIEEAKS